MAKPIRVTVWGENVHERKNPIVAKVYPDGMHNCIAEGLREDAGLGRPHCHPAGSGTRPNGKRSRPRPTSSSGGATPRTAR